MKVNIQDQNGTQLTGWKYWAAISILTGAMSSIGGEFPQYTPYSLFNAYTAEECKTNE